MMHKLLSGQPRMRPDSRTTRALPPVSIRQATLRLCGACLVVGLALAAQAGAQPIPAAPSVDARSYVVMDFHSGEVVATKNADQRVDPASITKLMTTLVAFQELRAGHLSLTDMVNISEKAWRTPGSRMFIEVGTQVSVQDLLRGIIIQSGNDASVALAEHIAGSEDTFAEMMNDQARRLGLHNTHYTNSTGLPGEEHYATAADVALLSRALIREFPQYYTWYSEKDFTFNEITQLNRNLLLQQDPTVDGLKTGHTEAAGYCLAASAVRDDMRLISVVMGASSESSRASASRALLAYGFRFFETHRLFGANQPVTNTPVWKGASDSLELGLAQDLYVTVARGQYEQLQASTTITSPLLAPVPVGHTVGQLTVALGDRTLAEQELIALSDVARGSLLSRAMDTVRLWFE